MKKSLWLIGAALVLGENFSSAATTTYSYTGPLYLAATGLYSDSMRITGTFSTASALPKNMALTPIGPYGGSNLVTRYSFFDGVSTYTNVNSVLLYEDFSQFSVSTDSSGNVASFNIGLMAPAPPNTVGEPMNAIALSPFLTQATTATSCSMVIAGACNTIPLNGANVAISNSPGPVGVWEIESAAAAVPTLSEYALVALGIGMVMLAVPGQRRRVECH